MNPTLIHSLPIGVFDSGVGGLTVLRALQQQLPSESFLYLGDTARLPYGTKSPETVIRYAKQASQILVNRGVKFLIVACNTASTIALPTLRESFTNLPIIGVLEPGAKAACSSSVSGNIAVIATEATVRAAGYQAAIKKFRPEAQVIAQSCGLLVALAEEGWTDGPITEAVARRYLEPLLTANGSPAPDCLVLGCTHFPALIASIKKVVGSQIVVIDSAKTTAELVDQTLRDLQLHNQQSHSAYTKFLVTDAPARFVRVAKQFLGMELNAENVELVDL